MEKYGVVEDEPGAVKTAGDVEPKTCPVCESPLSDTVQTGVLLCPKCGTKPFEKK